MEQCFYRRGEDVAAHISDEELDIPTCERGGFQWGVSVLSQSKELKESNEDHVHDRAQLVPRRTGGKVMRNEGNPADN